MRRPFLLAVCLLLPGWAAAQTGTLTLSWAGQSSQGGTDTTVSNLSVGPSRCDETVGVVWQVQQITTACTALKLWLTTQNSCGDDPASTDQVIAEVASGALLATTTGTGTAKVADLPIFTTEAGKTCSDLTTEKELLVCGSVKVPPAFGFCGNGSPLVVKSSVQLKLLFDALAPSVPTLEGVDSLDSALSVRFSNDSDAVLVKFIVREKDTGSLVSETLAAANVASARLGGLENGKTYLVSASAEDAAGNTSAESAPVEGTPVRTDGFWAIYRQAGGTESGGCSAVGGQGMGVWVAAWLCGRLFWRRKVS